VFGRRAGSVQGFDYSPALAGSKLVWDAASLERWLADPDVIPGQRMSYSLGDASERADMVAFLRSPK
jgi:cytochrome c